MPENGFSYMSLCSQILLLIKYVQIRKVTLFQNYFFKIIKMFISSKSLVTLRLLFWWILYLYLAPHQEDNPTTITNKQPDILTILWLSLWWVRFCFWTSWILIFPPLTVFSSENILLFQKVIRIIQFFISDWQCVSLIVGFWSYFVYT